MNKSEPNWQSEINSGSISITDAGLARRSTIPHTKMIDANTDCVEAITISAVAGRARRAFATTRGSSLFAELSIGGA